ncbi:MAG: hypothetical protein V5A79_06905 [Candidatus Bipolaricaulota bacterium]
MEDIKQIVDSIEQFKKEIADLRDENLRLDAENKRLVEALDECYSNGYKDGLSDKMSKLHYYQQECVRLRVKVHTLEHRIYYIQMTQGREYGK